MQWATSAFVCWATLSFLSWNHVRSVNSHGAKTTALTYYCFNELRWQSDMVLFEFLMVLQFSEANHILINQTHTLVVARVCAYH